MCPPEKRDIDEILTTLDKKNVSKMAGKHENLFTEPEFDLSSLIVYIIGIILIGWIITSML